MKSKFRRATIFTISPNLVFVICKFKTEIVDPDKSKRKRNLSSWIVTIPRYFFPKQFFFQIATYFQTTFEKCTIAAIKFRSLNLGKNRFCDFQKKAFENRTRQKSFWEKFVLL